MWKPARPLFSMPWPDGGRLEPAPGLRRPRREPVDGAVSSGDRSAARAVLPSARSARSLQSRTAPVREPSTPERIAKSLKAGGSRRRPEARIYVHRFPRSTLRKHSPHRFGAWVEGAGLALRRRAKPIRGGKATPQGVRGYWYGLGVCRLLTRSYKAPVSIGGPPVTRPGDTSGGAGSVEAGPVLANLVAPDRLGRTWQSFTIEAVTKAKGIKDNKLILW